MKPDPDESEHTAMEPLDIDMADSDHLEFSQPNDGESITFEDRRD